MKKVFILSIATSIFFLISCSKNQDTPITPANVIPTLTTNTASSITATTVSSGGNIASDGGASITARGVVWSTSLNPTIPLATKTNDGTGIGSFTSTITGLKPNTTYYINAYATNNMGTAYGTAVAFVTLPLEVSLPSVKIGAQVWTNKNLDVATYKNGDPIPQVTDSAQWANLTTGAWCYYNNDPATNAIYGKLYNWYAINDARGLAPQGWHIPSDDEWTTLVDNLGGTYNAGGKMKDTSSLWESPNNGATNESGFTALPGGLYDAGIGFEEIGKSGFWWSATEDIYRNNKGKLVSISHWYNYLNAFLTSNIDKNQTALSVRCIKN